MNLFEFSTSIDASRWSNGAAEGIRTPDPRITNALLYQLSYRGTRALFTGRHGAFQGPVANHARPVLEAMLPQGRHSVAPPGTRFNVLLHRGRPEPRCGTPESGRHSDRPRSRPHRRHGRARPGPDDAFEAGAAGSMTMPGASRVWPRGADRRPRPAAGDGRPALGPPGGVEAGPPAIAPPQWRERLPAPRGGRPPSR